MSDVGGVQGGESQQPISPEEIERYKKDHQDSFKLFQDSFAEYNKSDVEAHKKAKLQDVMDEALNIMNETACVSISKGKQEKEAQLNRDYQTFIENPTPENQKKVADHISALQ